MPTNLEEYFRVLGMQEQHEAPPSHEELKGVTIRLGLDTLAELDTLVAVAGFDSRQSLAKRLIDNCLPDIIEAFCSGSPQAEERFHMFLERKLESYGIEPAEYHRQKQAENFYREEQGELL